MDRSEHEFFLFTSQTFELNLWYVPIATTDNIPYYQKRDFIWVILDHKSLALDQTLCLSVAYHRDSCAHTFLHASGPSNRFIASQLMVAAIPINYKWFSLHL